VLCVSCNVEADELLHLVQQIEREAGRERLLAGYADRTLDIDILFYGDRVVTMPGLTIPHPHMTERRFVLEPLCELAPDFIHPVLKLPLHRLLEQCKDSLSVRKLNT
jgi:2-amino-4-hydroxy-6-hydroxymethyldihydropteridine diphosphokinase